MVKLGMITWQKEIILALKGKEKVLKERIGGFKKTRDEAQSAMESHHDTTKSEMEKMVLSLEQELVRAKSSREQLTKSFLEREKSKTPKVGLGSLIHLQIDEKPAIFCLVPEGIGGEKIGQITLLSVNSPLGKKLIGKK